MSESGAGARSPGWWWPFVAAACLLSLALHGYQLHGHDDDFWIPVIQDAAHPELYPDDPHVAVGHRALSLHFDALALPVRAAGLPWSAFVLYVLVHALLFASFASLARALLDDPDAAALAVALLVLPRPLGGTATVTVEALLLPRFVAEALAVLALALAVRGRPALAGLALGAVLLEHPLTAVPAFAALALRPLVQRTPWRHAATSVGLGALVGLPLVVRRLAATTPPSTLGDAEWWRLAREAVAFPFVDLWSDAAWLYALAAVAILALGAAVVDAGSRRRILALALGPAVALAVGVPLVQLSGRVDLVNLQPTRALLVVLLLGLVAMGGTLAPMLRGSPPLAVLGGALLGALLGGWWGLVLLLLAVAGVAWARTRLGARPAALVGGGLAALAFAGPWRETAVEMVAERPLRLLLVAGAGLAALALRPQAARSGRPAALALGLVAALLAWVGPAPVEWPWTTPSSPVLDVAQWAREATPRDARFVVPETWRGFRAASLRTTLLEGTDHANALFSRPAAEDFVRRRERFGAAATPDELASRLLAGEMDVLVLPRGTPVPGLVRVHGDAHVEAWARAPLDPAAPARQ